MAMRVRQSACGGVKTVDSLLHRHIAGHEFQVHQIFHCEYHQWLSADFTNHQLEFFGNRSDFLRQNAAAELHWHLIKPNKALSFSRYHAHIIVTRKCHRLAIEKRLYRIISEHKPFHLKIPFWQDSPYRCVHLSDLSSPPSLPPQWYYPQWFSLESPRNLNQTN